MTGTESPKKARYTPAGIIATLFGFLLGRYAVFFLMYPLVGALVVYVVARKLATAPARQIVLPAFSIQAGQLLWLIIGMIMAQQFGLSLVDVVLFGVGLIWLIVAPGKAPLVTLIVLQVIALIVNGFAISGAALGTAAHKALTVHIVFRVLAIGLSVIAIRKLRNSVTPVGLPDPTI